MMFPVTFDVTKHPLQGDECAVLVLSFLPKTFTDLLHSQQYLYEHIIPLYKQQSESYKFSQILI